MKQGEADRGRYTSRRMEPNDATLGREDSRAIDRLAQDRFLLPGDLLMENAGAAVAQHAVAMLRDDDLSRVIVLCGPGNNGGDGFVAARHLLSMRPHLAIEVFLLGDPTQRTGDAKKNLDRFEALGGAVRPIETIEDIEESLTALPSALVLDGLFGTGLTRPLDGLAARIVQSVNRSDCEVLAIDLPSGLDADTGQILGAAIRADVTVTFVATKPGFTTAAGPDHCGRVVVVAIGFPVDVVRRALRESSRGS